MNDDQSRDGFRHYTGHFTSSNLIRVVNPEAFETWCDFRQIGFNVSENEQGRWYRLFAAADYPGWPYVNLETGRPIDLAAELAEHLDPRDTAQLFGIYGGDRLRQRTIVHADGLVETIRFRMGLAEEPARDLQPARERDVAER
jgi:hypothetical protein